MTLAGIIGIVIVGWAVFTFNRLIRLRQLGDNAWSDIDVQLKRRHDLIPNVVAVVQATLTDVEDHLQNARRYYNAVVRDFNTAIAQFPAGIIAAMLRLRPREFFGLTDPSERAVPKVPLALLLLALPATSLSAQRSYS